MTQPKTRLDVRFSDPGAAATGWDQTRAALEAAELFWLTTVRADGRPHVTPLVAVWLDGAIHFCTGPKEQKAINLSGNPRVALTTGCGRWDGGLDIVVEGLAVRVFDEQTLERLARAWTSKWDGRWHFVARDGAFHHKGGEKAGEKGGEKGEAWVYSVRPSKVLAFGKEPFSHTSHHFPALAS
ncbi:MAG TPA: pyridoxamine 5'-phosphate oxidase family protein [Candidatus Limnocylindrales bacterium]|nr:pyridoxamine 5'-phosphate oxidase family protein [Candidatus Limnocylindrales bacterium]